MKLNKWYLALAWVLTVGVAYLMGWWSGVKSTTHVVAGAADSGIWLALGFLAVVAIVTAVLAFRTRGYLDHRTSST